MPATPRGRCSTTSTRASGTTSCSRLLDVPRVGAAGGARRRAKSTAKPRPTVRRPRFRSPASPATSRPRFRPDLLPPGHGQEHLRHRLFHADERRRRSRGLAAPAAHDGRLATRQARPNTPWRAASSSAARSCSGCGTAWASSSRPRRSKRWPPACPTPAASISCPRSPAWARRTGTSTPAARSPASRAAPPPPTSPAPALESIAFQVADVLDVMQQDSGVAIKELRVDGGASANNLLLQFQADLLRVPVVRPKVTKPRRSGPPIWPAWRSATGRTSANVRRHTGRSTDLRAAHEGVGRQVSTESVGKKSSCVTSASAPSRDLSPRTQTLKSDLKLPSNSDDPTISAVPRGIDRNRDFGRARQWRRCQCRAGPDERPRLRLDRHHLRLGDGGLRRLCSARPHSAART